MPRDQLTRDRRTKGRRTIARTRIVATAAMVVLLSACAQTKGWLDSVRGDRPSSSSNETIILGAPEANEYLKDLYDLAAGDPATQAEIFADAHSRATLTPDPSTTLRYALVLATPGHPESDAEQAQSLLRELLTQTELMTPAEISLATIHLKSVEERIVISSEARRLRAATSRAARTEEAAINRRLATVEAENRRLRRELDDAETKLEALTSIERSIREQGQ